MRDPLHTPECFAGHMGPWAIEPNYLHQALAAIRSGLWRPRAEGPPAIPGAPMMPKEDKPTGNVYALTEEGVGVVPLHGPMMKMRSKFGGVSTVDARHTIRQLAQDPKVGAILLHIDSPGGQVAGTKELADDISAAGAMKPVHAFIEDMGGSAAYWIASQAKSITVNAMAMVGSLGTYMTLADTSKAAEMEGVKVHLISTGGLKGALSPGLPITDEALAHVRALVDGQDQHFRAAVRAGRGMDPKALEAAWTGETWLATEAKRMGLVDRIESYDAAVERLSGPLRAKAARAKYAGR